MPNCAVCSTPFTLPPVPRRGRIQECCTPRCVKRAFDQRMKHFQDQLTDEINQGVAAEQLYRVRKYLLAQSYEEWGGWADPGDAKAYAFIGRHLRENFVIH